MLDEIHQRRDHSAVGSTQVLGQTWIVSSPRLLKNKDYSNWESLRLERVVVLSARMEDNEGLEDFLIREFFGAGTGSHGLASR
ncbi:MAG: hypothetical protein Q8O64_19435 [Sideroxyarcus sp.]|nr:hypothetical protein [Sideroxyarcus sp.]